MNVKKEVKYTNQFGEEMILRLDDNDTLWFKHEDCNSEFEKIEDLYVDIKVGKKTINTFNYVLDSDERAVFEHFTKGHLAPSPI